MPSVVIDELLRFYDGDALDASTHSAAINSFLGEELGVALLRKYLVEAHVYKSVLELDHPCTTKGAWLDRWLLSTEPSGQTILCQVEIKNWCAHSIGGRSLPVSATGQQLSEHLKKNWMRYWDQASGAPREKKLQKVLYPMRRPPDYASNRVIAVACVWDALHPSGELQPWFSIPAAGHFDSLHWFSMSSYLRSLRQQEKTQIQLEMEQLRERVEWLGRMFEGTI